ncbi:type II toxin-antitoxin system PemK/MazF family toxin [Skermania sp. ID1734]|uniref:type II toxin-antitoxin system PemK/MazF family toxin n=1 Tax=Skermania sp. ID1734 TaxID=2597516 RepID=UPI00118116DA|nr:type II toxin-antitoxin system PemK/MazF family toxin [Skermania sp. ID1734]TSD96087.1 type II toxin-antitoxin system PemK/MazF family toxin [Skermania sp. ID1734]
MRRGEVWSYTSTTRTPRVLVVSSDMLNYARLPIVVDVTEIESSFTTLGLLTVSLGDGIGYARCMGLFRAEPSRFEALLAQVSDDVMEQVDMALRVALDL